jgi:SAM-dependent methyltransferase
VSPTHLHNRRAWDERAQRRAWHTEPATEKDFLNPLAAVDDCGWLGGNVRGRRVLCLAAGGGKHGPLLAAAGAEATVVDLSPVMLEQDRRVAAERGLTMRTVEASMDNLSMLPNACFEVVIQPVSTCYAPDLAAVYREVARVTAPGGLYISQHKQPASLQGEVSPSTRGYTLTEPYYRTDPLPPAMDGLRHREGGTVEFLHRWGELLGGLCRAGFVIEDLVEPRHEDPLAEPGTFGHRCRFLPPFVTVKARRAAAQGPEPTKIWTGRV